MAKTCWKLFLIAGLASTLAGFSASAAPIDLSTWTCKQFLASDGDEMKLTLAWLDAYYKGENDPSHRYGQVRHEFSKTGRVLREESLHRPDHGDRQAVQQITPRELPT